MGNVIFSGEMTDAGFQFDASNNLVSGTYPEVVTGDDVWSGPLFRMKGGSQTFQLQIAGTGAWSALSAYQRGRLVNEGPGHAAGPSNPDYTGLGIAVGVFGIPRVRIWDMTALWLNPAGFPLYTFGDFEVLLDPPDAPPATPDYLYPNNRQFFLEGHDAPFAAAVTHSSPFQDGHLYAFEVQFHPQDDWHCNGGRMTGGQSEWHQSWTVTLTSDALFEGLPPSHSCRQPLVAGPEKAWSISVPSYGAAMDLLPSNTFVAPYVNVWPDTTRDISTPDFGGPLTAQVAGYDLIGTGSFNLDGADETWALDAHGGGLSGPLHAGIGFLLGVIDIARWNAMTPAQRQAQAPVVAYGVYITDDPSSPSPIAITHGSPYFYDGSGLSIPEGELAQVGSRLYLRNTFGSGSLPAGSSPPSVTLPAGHYALGLWGSAGAWWNKLWPSGYNPPPPPTPFPRNGYVPSPDPGDTHALYYIGSASFTSGSLRLVASQGSRKLSPCRAA